MPSDPTAKITSTWPDKIAALLHQAVGPGNWRDQPDQLAPFNQEWRGTYQGAARLVLLPTDTDSLVRVVRLCAEHGIEIVPQGGNTGLVGGAVASAHQVIVSLSQMKKLRQIDPVAGTMTIEAGATLAEAQLHAAAQDMYFPLNLASQSRCQIGGNLSTNAGGMAVLKYGMMRDLTLGLEVVLPDGRVVSQLSGLRKDNTGYDLRHIFIGAEGTLGIITAACVKIFPSIKQRYLAWVGFPSPDAALGLLADLRRGLGDAVASFELMNKQSLDFVLAHKPGSRQPLASPPSWQGLILVESPQRRAEDPSLSTQFEKILAAALDRGTLTDATLAANDRQADALFALREAMSDAQKPAGASLKHDVSLPLARIPEFLARAGEQVAALAPGTRIVAFGHVGDGNIHYNLTQPGTIAAEAFLARRGEIGQAIYRLVVDLGGSISAEHGIGMLRRQDFLDFTPPDEIAVMRGIKRCFDPKNIMNPGKILAV